MLKVALVLPAYKAVQFLPRFFDAVEEQDRAFDDVIVIDSSPDTETETWLRLRGIPYVRLHESTFDHGGTRNLGWHLAQDHGMDIVVFFSQDAVLADSKSLSLLVAVLEKYPTVAAAYGRQLPRPGASRSEKVGRAVRYPGSHQVNTTGHPTNGTGQYFFSNAFGAYRVSALAQIEGFPEPVLFGEDAAASFALQRLGHAVHYVPEATVLHSHPASAVKDFKRHFDIGYVASLASSPSAWADASAGTAIVRREISASIAMFGILSLPSLALIQMIRLLGYSSGRLSRFLPLPLAYKLSSAPHVLRKIRRLNIGVS